MKLYKLKLTYIMQYLLCKKSARFINDKLYLKLHYWSYFGKRCNLNNPKTFNEKMQWLKLYDRKPEYTLMADKYEVKKIIKEKIGNKYVIPTIGIYNNFDEIEFDKLPNQFVMKSTHDSGGVCICKEKENFDIEAARKKLTKSLERNYFWRGREWPYKNIPPRILIEKYMQNQDDENLNVYKIFCFSGKPTIIQTIQNDKHPNETIDYFDTEWRLLDLRQNFPNSTMPLEKPKTLDEMLHLATQISKDFPFIRTDFYEINGEVYFSEFTFYSDGGMAAFSPDIWDRKLGDMIILP